MVITLMLLLSSLTPFQTTADVFCDNVKFLVATLPNKISSSPVHFATATIGHSPDIVYALAFCRGDVLNETSCADCLTNTFSMVQNATPPDVECFRGASYYGECMLFYNFKDILSLSYTNTSEGENGGDPPFQRWNVKNDVRLIGGVLIQQLLVKTVEEAASTTPRRFATGVMDSGRDFPKVYSMAQCTPDLSTGDCLACLTQLLGMVNFTMYLRIGGQMGAIRCFFRYDSYLFYQGEPMLHLGTPLGTSPAGPAPTPTKHKRRMLKAWTIPVAVVVPVAAAAFMCCIIYSHRIIKQRKSKVIRFRRSIPSQDLDGEEQLVWQEKNSEFLVFDLKQLLEATNNFSEENKLGQGGFGAVYKAKFPGGLDIAVKRLASHSGQGFIEFKNEVQLIAKLQHMNLVRLLGCCSQEGEKVLVYEYLQNKSLDFFIFDENRRRLLDFSKIVAIIEGIADGLLYLHKHSRLRVIHRDLKPSNILLDSEMNPKISDFGLAKIFNSNNTEGNTTRRVVGTYGYMAPEYASEGVFSIKSDVFSFGVIIFEILTGKRNSRSQHCGDFVNLLGYAWQLWEERRWIDLVDASLVPSSQSTKVMRYINIALLCVQENAADRPSMTDVVAMLSNETMIMSQPKQPAYFNLRVGIGEPSAAIETRSINDMTLSVIIPR